MITATAAVHGLDHYCSTSHTITFNYAGADLGLLLFIVIDETPSELYNEDKVQRLLKITIGGCHEIR